MNYCNTLSDANAAREAMTFEAIGNNDAAAIGRAQTALSSVMRDRMKPTDADYAQRLIRESRSRILSSSETAWLVKFGTWYDSLNKKFWDYWDNGGREETEALRQQARVQGATRASSATKPSNSTAKSATTSASGNDTLKPASTDPVQEPLLKPMYLVGLAAVVGVVGYMALRRK